MCEAAEYCRHIDLLWIGVVGLFYGAGVLVACYAEHRALQREHKKGR